MEVEFDHYSNKDTWDWNTFTKAL